MLPDPAQMTPAEFFNTLMLAAAVPLLVFALVPSLMSFLGLTRTWFTARENPQLAEPDGSDPAYEKLAAGLAAIGYRPVGMVVERSLFYGHEWLHTCRVRKFVSPDELVYVAIYRHRPAAPWRLAFSSVGDAGLLVQTASPGVGLTLVLADHVRTEVGRLDIPVVESQHRANLAKVAAASGQRMIPVSLAELARVDERVSRAQEDGPGHLAVFQIPFIWFVIPAVVFQAAQWVALKCLGVQFYPGQLGFGASLFGAGVVYAWNVLTGLPERHAATDKLLAELMEAFPPVDLDQLLPQAFPAPGRGPHDR